MAVEGLARGVVEDAIGWAIFENPERLNALSEDMAGQAAELVRGYASDAGIRVVILRGAGEKAFISGGDISKFRSGDSEAGRGRADRVNYDALKAAMKDCPKPVLAMIHGYCLGGGMGLALSADVRIAAASAQLGIPAAKRALGYPWEYLRELIGIVGPAVAKDVMFSGRRIGAEEALCMGLVNRVFPAETLEEETRAYAAELAENAPLTIRAAKFCIDELMKPEGEEDRAAMQAAIDAASDSEDFKEATRSFMEKRKPVFRGK